MAGQSGQVIAINGQEGNNVILSVPMVGFPEGFELHKGDQVVLVQGDEGPAVRPLTRASSVDRLSEAKSGRLSAAGREFALQNATVRAEAPDNDSIVFSVPNVSGQPEQVISVRQPK